MKKFFGTGLLLVSLLLVLAIQSGYSSPTVPDDDVGIVYSIADNSQMPIIAIANSEPIQIARGVSVPDKGLIKDAEIYTEYKGKFEYFDNNISPTENTHRLSAGFRTEKVNNRFATDLGLRWAPSVIS